MWEGEEWELTLHVILSGANLLKVDIVVMCYVCISRLQTIFEEVLTCFRNFLVIEQTCYGG